MRIGSVNEFEIRQGNALAVLRTLPEASAHACVTSPPYWGLRDYGVEPIAWGGDPEHRHHWGPQILVNVTNHTDKRRWNHTRNGRGEEQPTEKRPGWPNKIAQGESCVCGAWRGALGLEPTPELYVRHLVEVFRAVRRVLRRDGTCWLNLGDSYARDERKGQHKAGDLGKHAYLLDGGGGRSAGAAPLGASGLKPKDLCGIPWRVALALQADGWYLRSDIIWAKPNPMPESVTDRPTRSHEHLFLLAKSARYFYDHLAIAEPVARPQEAARKNPARFGGANKFAAAQKQSRLHSGNAYRGTPTMTRNRRSVWTIATQPYAGAHFATYPRALVEPCIKAGTSEYGCCPGCGAQWRRVALKSVVIPIDYQGKWRTTDAQSNGRRLLANIRARRQAEESHDSPFPQSKTTGWEPTCRHRKDPVSCTVLDPFCGSGTTGVVALHLGRRFIGIELNPNYVELARRRIAENSRLWNKTEDGNSARRRAL